MIDEYPPTATHDVGELHETPVASPGVFNLRGVDSSDHDAPGDFLDTGAVLDPGTGFDPAAGLDTAKPGFRAVPGCAALAIPGYPATTNVTDASSAQIAARRITKPPLWQFADSSEFRLPPQE